MADPVVTISGGVPNSGTGTITTLGQVVAPQGASTATGESGTSGPVRGPLVQGATVSSAPSYTVGTINPLLTDTSGNLKVNVAAGGAAGGTSSSFGSAFPAAGTAVGFTDGTNMIAGRIKPASTVPVASDPAIVVSISPNSAGLLPTGVAGAPVSSVVTMQGISGMTPVMSELTDGTNNVAVKGGSTVPAAADPALVVSLSPNSSGIIGTGTAGLPASQVLSVQGLTGMTPVTVQGDVASGSSDTGNPAKIGGRAATSNPTAVTNGQRVGAMFDKLGKQVTVGALRDVKGVQKTSISTGSETTVITAGAAGVFNDVYAIMVTNKSATSVFVDFKDATAGTTRMTLAAPANDTRGFTVTVDSAMVQAVAANNWTATVSTAVTSIEITMLYVSNL